MYGNFKLFKYSDRNKQGTIQCIILFSHSMSVAYLIEEINHRLADGEILAKLTLKFINPSELRLTSLVK